MTTSLGPVVIALTDGGGVLRLGEDDPAEGYHEASKLHPSLLRRQMSGVRRLERDAELRRWVLRAGRRFARRPTHVLPAPEFPPTPIEAVMRRRRSSRPVAGRLVLPVFSTILFAANGVTRRAGGTLPPDGRTTPSAGALYPMNAYVATMEVEGLPPGLYHYDPGRHALAEIRRANLRGDLGGALVERSNADAAAMLFLTASFWRCRFKYGLRGYRFALLEAGHIAQNAILAAAALDVAALPIGGYFDRRIDGLLDIDGLHESTIYLIALGPRRAETRA